MIELCRICQNPMRRMRVEHDLAQGLEPSVIATRHRVQKSVVEHHQQHWHAPSEDSEPSIPSEQAPMASSADIFLPNDPMRRVKYHVREAAQAWQNVDEDRRTAARLQMILEEAFADPGMGLP